MKRGFTIVELMVVIAVLAILSGIVTVAALGAIKNGRAKRAEAMRVALEQGIAAYYAQEGRWPDAIESKAGSMTEDIYTFTPDEADKIFRQVVGKGFGRDGAKSMLVDATALFVCNVSGNGGVGNQGRGCYDNHGNRQNRKTFCGGQGCRKGVDFSLAVARGSKSKIPFDSMAFGYQGAEYGMFCRFWIKYNARTDSVSVSKSGPAMN
jgi:prepilin-type N-terminal cleavage/methylation domain-containing protein